MASPERAPGRIRRFAPFSTWILVIVPRHSLRLDVVEDFHRLDDADIGFFVDGGAHRDKRLGVG